MIPANRRFLLSLLLAVGLFVQGWHLLPNISSDLKQIWGTKGQPALWRGARNASSQNVADYLTFLDEVVPEAALVVVPPVGVGPQFVSRTQFVGFFLDPREVTNVTSLESRRAAELSRSGAYVLIVNQFPGDEVASQPNRRRMFNDSWGVYLPAGGETCTTVPFPGYRSLVEILAAAFWPGVLLITLAIAGGLVLHPLLPDWTVSAKLAAGYGVGLGGWTLGLATTSILGIPLNGLVVAAVMIAVLALGVLSVSQQARKRGLQAALGEIFTRPSRIRKLDAWQIGILVLAGLAGVVAVGKGYHATDAVLLWGAKGYGIAADLTVKTVMDHGTNTVAYPLHIPLAIAGFKSLFGDHLPASKMIFSGYYLALVLVIYHFLIGMLKDRTLAGLSTLVLATIPVVFTHATIGYANLALAYYLAAAVLFVSSVVADSNQNQVAGRLLLGGCLFGLAAWTRPEGLVMGWLSVVLLTFWFFWRSPGRESLRRVSRVWVPLLVYSGFWLLVLRTVYTAPAAKTGIVTSALVGLRDGNLHLPEAGYILRFAGTSLVDLGIWGVIGLGLLLAMMAGLVSRDRARASQIPVVWAGLFYVMFILGTYYITSYDSVHDVSWWVNNGLNRMQLPGIILLWIGAAVTLRSWAAPVDEHRG